MATCMRTMMACATSTIMCTSVMHVQLASLRIAVALAFASAALLAAPCRADTVASLLGNFTVNQFAQLHLAAGAADVHYAVVFGQLPALRELHLADTDGDGVTTEVERSTYAERLAPTLAQHLLLTVDGVPVPLHATHWTTSLPTEQGGFSLRVDIDLTSTLTPAMLRGAPVLTLSNQNYPGQFGWQEMAVNADQGIAVFDTDAFSTSLTGGLTQALQEMPPAGPLAERAVHLRFTQGAVPDGAQVLQPRPGTPAVAAGTPAGSANALQAADGSSAWLVLQTRRLVDLISAANVPLHIALLALLAAAVLGALHAFAPGHGKTVVGAYLIGSRGTARHAVFLGITVTITHTLGVFALGFATLAASRYVVPERLLPVLGLVSGLLVLGMGVVLLTQRWRSARAAARPATPQTHAYRALDPARVAQRVMPLQMMAGSAGGGLAFAHQHGAHDHAHDHVHTGIAAHAHDPALMHSHGGVMHSHLPPGATGERITWRSLLTLGISGGLVPCPSAMVLLLAAVALNKTAYGLLLVLAFSVGLAATLTAVGLAFLFARNRFPKPRAGARWPQWLPVASAAAITAVGVAMSYAALVAFPSW